MLRLEMRPQASSLWSIASPLLALAITVVLGATLFIALGKDPVRGLQMFFWEPIKSSYALGELMVKATPLLLIALGLAVCFRSNVWNIGAEGQFVLGAICAGGVALMADKESTRWIVLAILLAGVAGGMAWAAVPAFLRVRLQVSEILTGTECSSGPLQQDCAYAGVALDRADSLGQFRVHHAGKTVEFVGPIERDPRNPCLHRECDCSID